MRNKFILLILTATILSGCISTKPTAFAPAGKVALSEEEQRAFTYHFYEGLRLKEEGQFAEAYVSFLNSHAIDSLDAGLLVEISLMQLTAGEVEAATRTMQNALLLDPDNWWYSQHLIQLYVQQQKFNEAISIGTELLKKFPRRESSYTSLIPLYKQTEQWQQALSLYEKLEKMTGVNEQISFDKFRLLIMLNKPKRAFQEFDKLIVKYPHENRYKILKGDILLQQGQTQKAFELYQHVLNDEPQNPYVHISLSEFYNTTGDTEKAMDYMLLALKNSQLNVQTKLEMMEAYLEHIIRNDGNLSETETLFQLLVEYYPLEEAVHGYYAAFLQHMERNIEAASVFESMLAINPTNGQSWFSLMQVHFALENYEQVVQIADRAIAAVENNLNFYFYKGITLQLMERYQEAIDTHNTAISLFKETDTAEQKSEFYAHLGDLHLKLDEIEAAFIAYEEAVVLNPNNVHALNNYAYFLSLEKRELAKAERMSAKTIEKEPRNSTYLDTYAWIFYQQGNYSLAKFYIERAIDNLKQDQSGGVIYEHYGDILWMTGNNDEKALEMWKKARELGVDSAELLLKIDNKGWDR